MTNLLKSSKIRVKVFDSNNASVRKLDMTLEQIANRIIEREHENRDSVKYYVVALLGSFLHMLIPYIYRLVSCWSSVQVLHRMSYSEILSLWIGDITWRTWYIGCCFALVNFLTFGIMTLSLSFAESVLKHRLEYAQYFTAMTSINR